MVEFDCAKDGGDDEREKSVADDGDGLEEGADNVSDRTALKVAKLTYCLQGA